jgi:hypothetical protein
MGESGDVLRAQIADTPVLLRRDDALRVTRSYLSSYDLGNAEQRISLFADRFIFEDPAGVLRASNKHMLRAFFAQLTVGGFQLQFEEKQVIVVGGSCHVAAVAYITVGERLPAMLELFIVFQTNEDGLIDEFRTYFDEHCVHDAAD